MLLAYGYGAGIIRLSAGSSAVMVSRVGVVAALAIGTFVYLAQVMISAVWLKYFRFGPVEWLWRTLMYGTPQRPT